MKIKRFLAVLLALSLCAACAGALAEDSPFVGTWYLNSITTGGMEIHPGTLGMDTTLDIAADGACTMVIGETTETGTWIAEGDTITLTSDTDQSLMAFTLVDGALTSSLPEQGIENMVFNTEPAEVPTYALPDVNPDAQQADFLGEWTCAYLVANDMVLPISQAGDSNRINLSLSETAAQMTASGMEIPAEAAFSDDGTLVLTANGQIMFTFSLLEDGTILGEMPDVDYLYLFEAVEE